MKDILNNPIYLALCIIGFVVIVCLICIIVIAIKRHNAPERIEKRRIQEQLKQKELEKENAKNNISSNVFNKPKISKTDKDVIKVEAKENNVDDVIKIITKSKKK